MTRRQPAIAAAAAWAAAGGLALAVLAAPLVHVDGGGLEGFHRPKQAVVVVVVSFGALAAMVAALAGGAAGGRPSGADAASDLGRRARAGFDGVDAAAFGVLATAFAAAATSGHLVLARRPLELVLAATAAFVIARGLGPSERALARTAVGLVAVTLAALVLAQAEGWATFPGPQRLRPGATMGQRNAAAHVLVLASPALWHVAVAARAPGARAAALAATAFVAAVVVVTRSRAAWLVLPVAGVVFAALLLRGRGARALRGAGPVLAALAVGAATAWVSPTELGWRSRTPYLDTATNLLAQGEVSREARLAAWRGAAALLRERPWLGHGPGTWLGEYVRVEPPPPSAGRIPVNRHGNADASTWLAERGGLGAMALLLFAAAVAARALTSGNARASSTTVDQTGAADRAAAGALLTAAVGLGCLDVTLGLPAGGIVTAVLLGVSTPRDPRGPPGQPSTQPRRWAVPRAVQRALAAALVASLVGAAAQSVARATALRLWASGTAGFDELERALDLAPDDLDARLELTVAMAAAGRCREAAPHLAWLEAHVPALPTVARARARCAAAARTPATREACDPASGWGWASARLARCTCGRSLRSRSSCRRRSRRSGFGTSRRARTRAAGRRGLGRWRGGRCWSTSTTARAVRRWPRWARRCGRRSRRCPGPAAWPRWARR